MVIGASRSSQIAEFTIGKLTSDLQKRYSYFMFSYSILNWAIDILPNSKVVADRGLDARSWIGRFLTARFAAVRGRAGPALHLGRSEGETRSFDLRHGAGTGSGVIDHRIQARD